MAEILINGGKVVSAECTTQADVAIEGGKITAVGSNLGEASRVIDATGKYVIPGGIDPHVHILLGSILCTSQLTGTPWMA